MFQRCSVLLLHVDDLTCTRRSCICQAGLGKEWMIGDETANCDDGTPPSACSGQIFLALPGSLGTVRSSALPQISFRSGKGPERKL